MTPHVLTQQEERFARALLVGQSPHDAYAEAFNVVIDESEGTRGLKMRATYLSRSQRIRDRLLHLQAPVLRKAQATFEFTLDMALEKSQRAYDLAQACIDPGNMLKAVELQAKLKKLLVSVSESRSSKLDEVSTEDLLLLLAEVRERRATLIEVGGEGESVCERGEEDWSELL